MIVDSIESSAPKGMQAVVSDEKETNDASEESEEKETTKQKKTKATTSKKTKATTRPKKTKATTRPKKTKATTRPKKTKATNATNEVVEEVDIQNKENSRMPVLTKEHQPQLLGMKDHFTLATPSSTIRFRNRNNAARVYENKQTQMVMEETYNPETDQSEITVRRLNDSTQSLQFLRATYSIVCALWTGFFFVFCLQVLLFMVLDLAIVSGATDINADIHYGQCIGVTIAIIVFVFGFADALTIAGHYIVDTWSGHFLVKQFLFTRLSEVAVDWIFFVFFLFVPVMTMCITLLADMENWWTVTSIVWFSCVCSFFVIFCFNVVYYEVSSAYSFAKNIKDGESDSWKDVIKRCIILRQRHDYSGKQRITYLAKSYFETTEDTEDVNKAEVYESTREEKIDLWSKFTRWGVVRTDTPGGLRLFKPLEKPVRLFTIDDVQDYRPFLTSQTWSLERIFCRPKNSRYIAIIDGPGHLTRAQIRSSLVCSALGTGMIVLVCVSFFDWLDIPGHFIAFAFVVCLLLAWNSLSNARRLMKISRNLMTTRVDAKAEHAAAAVTRAASDVPIVEQTENDEEEAIPSGEETDTPGSEISRGGPRDKSLLIWEEKAETRPSEAVFLVAQYNRVTRTTTRFCWVMFGLEVSFWYLFPMVTLFTIENLNVAILFIIVATTTLIRHYINAAVLIEETGNLDLVGGETEQEVWANKSRLSDIVEAITTGRSRNGWATLLGIGGFGFLAIFLSAIGKSTESTFSDQLTFLPSTFYYPPLESNMRYPTCRLANIQGGFGENSTMLDFAFLAGLPYKTDAIIDAELQSWFTDTIVEDDVERVSEFRAREDKDNAAVAFRLINFPEKSLALIMIRGTQNNWDMLADSQLWSAAALMQVVRLILPVGEIWTPILDQLVNVITTLQSEAIKKVSFYTLTTKFAKELKADKTYDSVQVTGHSLGGGLAIITGAQAKIPAIALSGPNALISGRSFDPPVTEEQLNRYTFNIIPNRDVVAMLDDKADQFQNIRCNAAKNDLVGCHTTTRSLCEIMTTCGSGNRPAFCECATMFGFDRPTNDGDEDFATLCKT